MNNIGLYIHIPFCQSKCIYCDFASFTMAESEQDKYTLFLIKEIEQAKKSSMLGNKIIDTIFFGGGTPSVLSEKNFELIANSILSNFDCDIQEWTVEVNPHSYDMNKLKKYKELGVTRISFGVQTLNDSILKLIGRLHSSNDAVYCINKAKSMGFDISVDLMLGLPNQDFGDIDLFVDTFDRLGVEHISAYMLKVEEGTYLNKAIQSGEINPIDDDFAVDLYDYCCDKLKKLGYTRYEISNFCKNNKYSKHNLKYWNVEEYLGLGVSAHSLLQNARLYNPSGLQAYYKRIESGKPYDIEQLLTSHDIVEEIIILGLRTDKGIDIGKLNSKYNIDFEQKYSKAIQKNKKYLDIIGGTIKIKEQYWAVMNSIIVDFME